MKKRLLIFAALFIFVATLSQAAWLTGYGFRKKITIQGTNLDAQVSHFPLLIYVSDADIDDQCDDDGDRSYDIRFTESDGSTELDIDWMDYTETGGNAVIWCFVSNDGWTIAADGSTYIYLYYGNAAAGDPATDTGVWDANFAGVFHQDLGAVNELDSTSNAHEYVRTNTPTQTATAKVFNAQDYENGESDLFTKTHKISTAVLGTISAWVNPESDSGGHLHIYSYGGDGTNFLRVVVDGADDFIHLVTTANNIEGDTTISIDTWYYVVVRSDGTAYEIDVNNTSQGLTANSGADNGDWFGDISDPVTGISGIGAWHRGWWDEIFDGEIDEVRVSNVKRADAWVKFEYYNANEADKELTWGSEETETTSFVPKVIIIR